MRRSWVVGTSGSGKSTLARASSERTGASWVQLDAVFHQAGWTPLPRPEFRAAIEERVAADSWMIDGNYTGSVGDLALARAETLVWLDLPRHVVMCQIVWWTVRRILTREELWNGNRERPRNFFSLDKEQSVIVWAWVTHGQNRRHFLAAQDQPAYQGLRFVRLRSRRQVDELVGSLGGRGCRIRQQDGRHSPRAGILLTMLLRNVSIAGCAHVVRLAALSGLCWFAGCTLT